MLTAYFRNKTQVAKCLGHGVNDAAFLELWNDEIINPIIQKVAEEILTRQYEKENELIISNIWVGIGLGRIEMLTQNAHFKSSTAKNNQIETIPEILKKYIGKQDKDMGNYENRKGSYDVSLWGG
jgi:hypothetical protein